MEVNTLPRHLYTIAAFVGLTLTSTGAFAQSSIAPAVAGDDPEFKIDPITAGPIRLSPQVTTDVFYNDNVLASPDGLELDDVEVIVRPELVASVGDEAIRFELQGFGEFSRFTDLTTEDSDTYGVEGSFLYSPSAKTRLNANAGYARRKEDRGDPEARDLAGPGPRLFDDTYANFSVRHTKGRAILALEGDFRDLDAISPIDDDRDFKSYAASATAGYRISGSAYATVTGFVNVRDFRLEETLLDPDRDATTYGAQIGASFIESRRLRGRARVGFFHFDPEDPTLDPRTGFSANVSLVYIPRRRTALILEGFNGDVATFRRGAQARTDTRVSLTVQEEIRHNFYGRVGIRYARRRFIGSGVEERVINPNIALEYLASRRLSFIAGAEVSDRTSDDLTQEFERFSVSLGARLRI